MIEITYECDEDERPKEALQETPEEIQYLVLLVWKLNDSKYSGDGMGMNDSGFNCRCTSKRKSKNSVLLKPVPRHDNQNSEHDLIYDCINNFSTQR